MENISDALLSLWSTYHVIGTYNGSYLKLYVDGVEVASKAVTGSITFNDTTVLALGTNPSGTSAGGSYLSGDIYITRLYELYVLAF